MVFVTLILFVVTLALSELLRPKPNIEDARPAGLGDFNFPTATEARVIPLVWGRVKVSGPNVVWYGDLTQLAITENVKTGLFSSTTITKGFTYYVGMQFGICRGPDVALRRIWVGDKQVWSGTLSSDGATANIDEPELFGGLELGQGGIQSTIEFQTGSTTQAVSTYLGLHQDAGAGSDRTPRYTGTCYIVARGLDSTAVGAYVGNSTQVKPWSFEVERFPALFSGQSAGENKIGSTECNPVNVLYEILTDTEWGFGFPAADIDLTSFLAAADTMITEANGFSISLTRTMQSNELIREIERQIDGVVFLDHRTGKWTIKLARADYDIDLVPQLTDSNVKEVRDYTRGSWEDTTNQITVKYWKRETDGAGGVNYKESFALAQDVANAMIQGGGTVGTANIVTGEVSFPGCKNSALASNLAWRELRGQSYPLARATFVINREFWDLTIGSVVAWTNAQLGFTKLPMRVTRIDYGRLTDNQITITAVQDVFQYAAASFGSPPDSLWDPPTTTLVAFPAAQQTAFEAPRALVVRDPLFAGDEFVSKVMAAARRQGGEVAIRMKQRNSSGTPSGSYADTGNILQFVRIGQLDANLGAGVANPTSTIVLDPTPDSKTAILNSFSNATTSDMGVDLVQLIMVNNEFMLVDNASDGGTTVDLNSVWRGALDSAQANHTAGDDVFLLFVGAGISDGNFGTTNNIDVQLRMRSASEEFSGSVTDISFAFAKRCQRPYPPAAVLYNTPVGSAFGAPDMEGDGAGENTYSADVTFWRRNYNPVDEVAALQADDTSVDASHQTRLRVFVDPSGSNTEIASSPFAWATGTGTDTILRNELIDIAAAGTEIRVELETRHNSPLDATSLTARHDFIHDVVPTSVNDGLFYLGGGIDTGPSNAFVVAAAGVHTVDVAAAPSAGNVEYRINGGGWLTVTPGGTATASLSISDTIEVRQSSTGATPDPNFVWIDNPSATRVAYGTI